MRKKPKELPAWVLAVFTVRGPEGVGECAHLIDVGFYACPGCDNEPQERGCATCSGLGAVFVDEWVNGFGASFRRFNWREGRRAKSSLTAV